jgi:hypothetical protein
VCTFVTRLGSVSRFSSAWNAATDDANPGGDSNSCLSEGLLLKLRAQGRLFFLSETTVTLISLVLIDDWLVV